MYNADAHTRVLVVDTDDDALELLGEYLRARGFDVMTAYAPEEAVALIRSVPVDVVVADLDAGAAALQLVHAARSRAVPAGVVMTCAVENIEDVVQAMKAGATDIVRKPFRLSAVFSAMEAALAGRERMRRERAGAERLLFFEATVELESIDGAARVLGLLAQVARADCGADEVAVWRPGRFGWSAVARGGQSGPLTKLDPATVVASGAIENADVVALPIPDGAGGCYAVVAVAGGRTRSPDDGLRLRRLVQQVAAALGRVAGGLAPDAPSVGR